MRACAAFAVAAAVMCVAPALAAPLDPAQVRIVKIAMPDLPDVHLRAIIFSGSADDPPGREGLASFTANLMRRGAESPHPEERNGAPTPKIGSFDVSVGKDEIIFSGRTALKDFDAWYAVLRDMILKPEFDRSELERQRADQKSAIEAVRDDDESLAREMLDLLLYRNHPYGHLDLGRAGSIEAFTREDILSFHRTHFVKGNIAIGLAGAVSDPMIERVRRDFADLPDGQPPRPARTPTLLPRRRVLLIEKEKREEVQIRIGEPITVTRAHADYFPMLIAGAYLGEPGELPGRLYREIRLARGLSESAGASVDGIAEPPAGARPGPLDMPRREQAFSMWVHPKSINAKFAIKLALAELQDLVKNGVPEHGIEETRAFMVRNRTLGVEAPERVLASKLDEILDGASEFGDRYVKAMGAVNPESVASAVRRHLTPDHLGIVAVVSDGAAFIEQMVSAETLIEYPPGITRDATRDRDLETVGMGLGLRREDFEIVKAADLFR